MPFVKLDCGILDSSIWVEPSDTRVCWITLLTMADAGGMVASTAPGIARKACISLEAARVALDVFESPDVDSRSLADEGRRIQRVDGGYQILNYQKYREKDHTAAERAKRYREKKLRRDGCDETVTVMHAEAEAEVEAEVEAVSTLFPEVQSKPKKKTAGAKAPGPSEEMRLALKGVFIHYLNALGRDRKKYTATEARKQKGYSRLREALAKTNGNLVEALALMCQAIDALAASPYHREHGYIDWIDNLFKSAEQFEKWLDKPTDGKVQAMRAVAPVKSAADKYREQLAEEERRHNAQTGN